jgi:hypothetical protein
MYIVHTYFEKKNYTKNLKTVTWLIEAMINFTEEKLYLFKIFSKPKFPIFYPLASFKWPQCPCNFIFFLFNLETFS